MTVEQVTFLLQETIKTTLWVSAPFLAAALFVGLLISVFQAATQVNEQTLTFVPKIVAVLATFGLLFPWIIQRVMDFTQLIMERAAQ